MRSLMSVECAGLPQQSHINQLGVQGEGVWSEELRARRPLPGSNRMYECARGRRCPARTYRSAECWRVRRAELRSGPAIFLYKEEKGQKGRNSLVARQATFLFDGFAKMRGEGEGKEKIRRGGEAKARALSKILAKIFAKCFQSDGCCPSGLVK